MLKQDITHQNFVMLEANENPNWVCYLNAMNCNTKIFYCCWKLSNAIIFFASIFSPSTTHMKAGMLGLAQKPLRHGVLDMMPMTFGMTIGPLCLSCWCVLYWMNSHFGSQASTVLCENFNCRYLLIDDERLSRPAAKPTIGHSTYSASWLLVT